MLERSAYNRGYFDPADRELVAALEMLAGSEDARAALSRLFQDDFHPLGIAELAAPRAVRLTGAMFVLLNTVEPGGAAMKIRLAALSALHAEAFEALGAARMPRNAARVLLAVAKEFVRTPAGDGFRRLELAHRLHRTMLGSPRFVRRMLQEYQLLEMPESGNQLAFDFHVHDANSKGRKSASHLVLDAWIKGIGALEAVYYDYVGKSAAAEFLRAASIMRIQGIVGVAHQVLWNGKFVEFICADGDCGSAERYLAMLDTGRRRLFRSQCRLAAEYRTGLVYKILQQFNSVGLKALNRDFDCELAPVAPETLAAAAPGGHPAAEHIAEIVTTELRGRLESELAGAGILPLRAARRRRELAELSGEALRERYFDERVLSEVPANAGELPELLRLTPHELLERYSKVVPRAQVTLNLSNLSLADVIELIWECRGKISDLEIFNLKDMVLQNPPDHERINRFRLALGRGNVTTLKSLIREAAGELGAVDPERRKKLLGILKNLGTLIAWYRNHPLGVRGGSDSAGRACRLHGMGLAVLDSLPARALNQVRLDHRGCWTILHWYCQVHRRISYLPTAAGALVSGPGRLMAKLGWRKRIATEFVIDDPAAGLGSGVRGNVVTLGGVYQPPPGEWRRKLLKWSEILYSSGDWNSGVKNALKIFIGFMAAFLSFFWSGSGWLLVWFGAPIWLGITGVRNVLQALAGGGKRNAATLPWRDLVSASRVADSLLYTGLSVPILENLVKNALLTDALGWTAENHAFGVFTVLAVANSFYILGHNLYRGLPKLAVAGNVFRPLLAIPLSVGFGWLLGAGLRTAGVAPVAAALAVQQAAAILSKLASDCVGGLIEGYADREYNLNCRVLEYQSKFDRIFESALALELLFPKKSAAALLQKLRILFRALDKKAPELEAGLVVNALDLLYFAMCRPLAAPVFRKLWGLRSPEERELLKAFPMVLADDRRIIAMFTAGLMGEAGGRRALAFYLNYHEKYLKALQKQLK